MTERLNEKLRIAKIVLEKLKEGSMRWTPLTKFIIQKSPSPWKAQTIIKWLLSHDYIERPERGIYKITEKGRHFLETL